MNIKIDVGELFFLAVLKEKKKRKRREREEKREGKKERRKEEVKVPLSCSASG